MKFKYPDRTQKISLIGLLIVSSIDFILPAIMLIAITLHYAEPISTWTVETWKIHCLMMVYCYLQFFIVEVFIWSLVRLKIRMKKNN